ncbi:MAG: carboxypeptidase-like regulatory domain-containing protein [Bacteroidota bacterium]|nr:carboxypeptidase-like regulatory domain-containing protein [Bacteroidota bacterium]
MKLSVKSIATLLFVLVFCTLNSQTATSNKKDLKKLVQFSGVVVESDSLRPLPFTSIIVKGTTHGTISDFYGFFTLVASPGDEIEFFSVAYKDGIYKIPDTLSSAHYSIIQVLRKDTVELPTATIYAWPSRDEFKKAFLKLDVAHNDYDRAQKNLEEAEMRELAKGISMDAQGNYSYAMQRQYTKLYYAGQYPPNNLLNPVAWAKFIKSWKEGKLKRK